jgi:DNA-binding IclR family transcriptional regulator
MKVSVSKSVARAFAIMEQFQQTREPATATSIRRRLNCPHSSAVAVLYNLAELGYLSHDREAGLFFPTAKLWGMAEWLRPAARPAPSQLGTLVDAIARDTGWTTALYSRVSLFTNALITRAGDSAASPAPPTGVGAALALSAPGLAILSRMEDEAMHAVLRGTTSWLSEAGATTRLDIAKTIADVAAVRRRGFALAPDRTRRSLQVLAYPLEREPLALAVSLPSSLPPSEVAAVRGAIECRLAPPETEIVMQPAAMLAKMQKGSKERLLF